MTLPTPPQQHPLFFTKKDLAANFKGSHAALELRIHRALKSKKFLQLKKGLYATTAAYFNEPDKTRLAEFFASKICQPSYLSGAYVLHKHHMLFEAPQFTSITTKTSHTIKNSLGTFRYTNLKKSLYYGFNETAPHVATKAKALFDHLYLHHGLSPRNTKRLKHELFTTLGLIWDNFSEADYREFDQYVWKSNSKKMMRVLAVITDHFESKKFDSWAKKLLA